MREYRVFASIFNDLLTTDAWKHPLAKECGHVSSVHTINCNAIEEIPDLFLNVCGNECGGMNSRIHWYVDAGDGWVLTDL